MKAWPIIIIFLLIGSYIIIKTNSIDVKESEGRSEFIFKFSRWIINLGFNLKTLAGNAVAMNWLPANTTNSTEIRHLQSLDWRIAR
jgi:hypothetical protein